MSRFSRRQFAPSKRWQIDFDDDYLASLNEDETRWLRRFADEFYSGEKLHDPDSLHTTEEHRRECYRRCYSATKGDVYTRASYSMEEIMPDQIQGGSEDAVVELIDAKNANELQQLLDDAQSALDEAKLRKRELVTELEELRVKRRAAAAELAETRVKIRELRNKMKEAHK